MRKKILLFIVLSSFAGAVFAQNWDINLAKQINPENPNSGYWLTMSGSAYFVCAAAPIGVLVAGIISKDQALKRKSYEIFGAIFIELFLSESIKVIVDRPRPAESYPGVIFPYHDVQGRSFPSGHTSLAFATAASLSIQFRKWWVVVPAYLYAASVGYSRIYLGVHYPSDVMAGAVLGVGSAYLAHWINKKLFNRSRESPAVSLSNWRAYY